MADKGQEGEATTDTFFTILHTQALLLIYLLIGTIARKRGVITKSGRQTLIDFLIRIPLPCMMFAAFSKEISGEQLQKAGDVLLAAIGVCLLSILLGKLFYRRYPYEKRSILEYGTLVTNASFAGLPLVASAFGDLGVFYASIFVIPNRIFMWSAGIALFTRSDTKTMLKKVLLNPGIIAIELGLLRTVFGWPLPTLVDTAVSNIGACVTPLAVIAIGAVLADVDIRTVFEPSVLLLSFVRLLLIPTILLGVMWLLGREGMGVCVSVVMSAMPVGTTVVLLAEQYGADSEFGSKCMFATTLLSLFTVPLMTLFL